MTETRKKSEVLMVGTAKGAFLFTSRDGRRTWETSGPHFEGTPVFHLAYDSRNKMFLAGVNSYQWGPSIARSFDSGKSWRRSKSQPKFPKSSGMSVKNIWHIEPGTEDEPDTIYAGVDPAVLFKSEDKGESWTVNRGLLNHETRKKWNPGAGGLCLHTILIDPKDPQRMHVGISAVGTMFTEDGGESWKFQNKHVQALFLPNKYPVFGQCVHKIVRHPERPGVLYQQNHCGQYRSDNNGEDWIEIQNNLPSRFGFPIAVDSNDPRRVYVSPLEGDGNRVSPNGRFAVWSSDNSGKEWHENSKGLPHPPSYFNVLREGMTSDREDPCGLYIGTTTGQLFFSRNQGLEWSKITDQLPPILSVSVAAVS
ncbi:MAG: exo-alpha-sialidase [Nitrososphaerota archaeon]|nr:exo-alpha-sialidase [Nitrososphaerota archaeon]